MDFVLNLGEDRRIANAKATRVFGLRHDREVKAMA